MVVYVFFELPRLWAICFGSVVLFRFAKAISYFLVICVSCAVSLSYLFVALFVVWAVSLVWGFFFELCLLWVTVTSYTSSLSYILFRLHLWHNMTTLPCCTYALSCHAELWLFWHVMALKERLFLWHGGCSVSQSQDRTDLAREPGTSRRAGVNLEIGRQSKGSFSVAILS